MPSPIFKVGEKKFRLIARESMPGYDLIVQDVTGTAPIIWGGGANDPNGSWVMESATEDKIMANPDGTPRTRRDFILWAVSDAKRRATAYATTIPPVPDHMLYKADNMAWNVNYNLAENEDQSDLVVPQSPLP